MRMMTWTTGILLIAMAGAAQAADGPQWLQAPNANAIAKAFPAVAQAMSVDGRVTLTCQSAPDGRMQACEVMAESPPGLGFGQVALDASRQFRIRPPSKGASTAGTLRIPMRFQVPPDPMLAKAKAYRPPKSPDAQKALARQVVTRVVPDDWLAAKVGAYVSQHLPQTPGPGEDPQALADARTAMAQAVQAGLPSMREATTLELAAHRSAAVLHAALDRPPADPGRFLDQQFKGLSPNWVLAEVAKIKADARARFCRLRDCG